MEKKINQEKRDKLYKNLKIIGAVGGATALASVPAYANLTLTNDFIRFDEDKYVPRTFTGSGAPAVTPARIGDSYVDTTNKTTYQAIGTTNSDDWRITNSKPYIIVAQDGTGDFNGTTSAVIQSAIDRVNTLGGGTVFIKKGTYNFTVSEGTSASETYGLLLYDNITLRGEGNSTILSKTDLTITSAYYTNIIYAFQKSNIIIKDLYFLGNQEDTQEGAKSGNGIKIKECENVTIQNITGLDGESLIDIVNCEFGINIENIFAYNNEHCILLESSSNININNISHKPEIVGVRTGYAQRGLFIASSSNINATNLTFKDIQATGIFIRTMESTHPCKNINISNAICEKTDSTHGTGKALLFEPSSMEAIENVNFTNCIFKNDNSRCAQIDQTIALSVKSIFFNNCQFYAKVDYAFYNNDSWLVQNLNFNNCKFYSQKGCYIAKVEDLNMSNCFSETTGSASGENAFTLPYVVNGNLVNVTGKKLFSNTSAYDFNLSANHNGLINLKNCKAYNNSVLYGSLTPTLMIGCEGFPTNNQTATFSTENYAIRHIKSRMINIIPSVNNVATLSSQATFTPRGYILAEFLNDNSSNNQFNYETITGSTSGATAVITEYKEGYKGSFTYNSNVGSGTFEIGQTITGTTSGATAEILSVSGTTITFIKQVGTFQIEEITSATATRNIQTESLWQSKTRFFIRNPTAKFQIGETITGSTTGITGKILSFYDFDYQDGETLTINSTTSNPLEGVVIRDNSINSNLPFNTKNAKDIVLVNNSNIIFLRNNSLFYELSRSNAYDIEINTTDSVAESQSLVTPDRISQSITPLEKSKNKLIKYIMAHISKTGTPPSDLTIKIHEVNGSDEPTTELFSTSIAVSDIANNNFNYRLIPIGIEVPTKFAVVFSGTNGASSNRWRISQAGTDTYSGGKCLTEVSSVWTDTGKDLNIKVIYEDNNEEI